MWKKIFTVVIGFFSSKNGKILIEAAVDRYVESNDNELTHDVADTIKKML